jgi:hypothetical protein
MQDPNTSNNKSNNIATTKKVGSPWITAIIVLLAAGLIFGFGYFFFNGNSYQTIFENKKEVSQNSQKPKTVLKDTDVPSFSIEHDSTWRSEIKNIIVGEKEKSDSGFDGEIEKQVILTKDKLQILISLVSIDPTGYGINGCRMPLSDFRYKKFNNYIATYTDSEGTKTYSFIPRDRYVFPDESEFSRLLKNYTETFQLSNEDRDKMIFCENDKTYNQLQDYSVNLTNNVTKAKIENLHISRISLSKDNGNLLPNDQDLQEAGEVIDTLKGWENKTI